MSEKEYSTIGGNVQIDPKATINHPVHFSKSVEIHAFTNIGQFTYINQYTVIYGRVSIGKFSIIARNCEIGVANHPIDWLSSMGNFKPYFPKHPDIGQSEHYPTIAHHPTHIGNDVWIGCNVVMKSGVTVGDGAIIAAGAVVVGDVEPYAIYGGIPAKFIRHRFDQAIIASLLKLKWWDLDTSFIAKLPRNDIVASVAMIEEFMKKEVEKLPPGSASTMDTASTDSTVKA
jgi:acetyltransferase-like isoleucine patch superfamily enzyme